MSAICGFVLRDRRRVLTPSPLQRMAEALPLRPGAGALHLHEFEGGGFACCEQFPTLTPDGSTRRGLVREPDLTVVCAAELYNANDLRRQVHPALPDDAGEAAIIAALYRRHGFDCVTHLRGAFAFALWDAQEERLLLATDAFGIQPLHYFCGDHGLVFGSRIKPILEAPLTPRRIDLQAVLHYVYFSCVPTPHTIYEGVRKLPPGHYLSFSSVEMRLESYWDVTYTDDPRQLADCAPGIPQYLAEAVRVQATYDSPADGVGAFLSGGTDSGAISGPARRVCRQPSR